VNETVPRTSASRLLGPGDPEPVGELNRGSRSPFFLICDHACNAVPRALDNLGLPHEELNRHIAIDIGAFGVATELAERLGASLVHSRYSRLVIDCNRKPEAASSMAAVADGTEVPGNLNLGREARAARIEEILMPYHRRIGERLDARTAAGLPTLLVSVHSFTPSLRARPADRPWHIGLCWAAADGFSRHVLGVLAEMEPRLVLGHNQPYDVDMVNDYSIPVHGEGRGLPYVEIEIRQDQIATPDGQARWAERLVPVLHRAAETFHIPEDRIPGGGA
jgi:predicted N-formylglutamate amidohydrolase